MKRKLILTVLFPSIVRKKGLRGEPFRRQGLGKGGPATDRGWTQRVSQLLKHDRRVIIRTLPEGLGEGGITGWGWWCVWGVGMHPPPTPSEELRELKMTETILLDSLKRIRNPFAPARLCRWAALTFPMLSYGSLINPLFLRVHSSQKDELCM